MCDELTGVFGGLGISGATLGDVVWAIAKVCWCRSRG